jgi:hypothetical protein
MSQPEFCDGVTKGCPEDKFENNTVTCRDAEGDCDLVSLCHALL